MGNLHRLQWIDAQIRAGRYPNARTLAAAFEISRRQALRDFEYLRDSLGAPLVYSARHRGFTYGEPGFSLPGPYVTASQKAALGHLADYYTSLSRRDGADRTVYADLAELFRRLEAGGAATRTRAEANRPLPPVPYQARLSGLRPGRLPPALQPFCLARPAPDQALCQFHDAESFLGALWRLEGCRVESPRWLRERLLARATHIATANADVTHYVTPAPLPSTQPPETESGETVRRDPVMARNEVSARFHEGWMSYIGAVQGILNSAGMGPWEYWHLMGATGMAFHMVMHERCCISSVTVYDWMNTHLAALSRIGVLSEVHEAMPGWPVYEAACRKALARIRESIDRGVGVVLWGVDTGEFGVVYGYDDEDGVLLTDGCFGKNGQPVLYENIGRSFADAPILHYQIILERVPVDARQTARSALQYYVDLMEQPGHPGRGYKAGLQAYDNWIAGLQAEDFDQRGCRYAAFVYAEARACAARYVEHLAESEKALAPAADSFRRTASLYQAMLTVLGQRLDDPSALSEPVTARQAESLLPLLRDAKQSEAETAALVRRYLGSAD